MSAAREAFVDRLEAELFAGTPDDELRVAPLAERRRFLEEASRLGCPDDCRWCGPARARFRARRDAVRKELVSA